MGLACYPAAVERGFVGRAEAAERALTTLRFLANSRQGPEADATGYQGFYYHFLDMDSGRRAVELELSTVDSAFLLAGALLAAAYFDQDSEAEADVRRLAETLYRRVDWQWALNGQACLAHGWRPESGFLAQHWKGYDEALLMYVLALGSPTRPLPAECYAAYMETAKWQAVYGHEHFVAGPLFIHQYSQMLLDFRGIQDDAIRPYGIDYFENSRRATLAQRSMPSAIRWSLRATARTAGA